jgi:hypothetical protein
LFFSSPLFSDTFSGEHEIYFLFHESTALLFHEAVGLFGDGVGEAVGSFGTNISSVQNDLGSVPGMKKSSRVEGHALHGNVPV